MYGESQCPVVDVIGKFSCGRANSISVCSEALKSKTGCFYFSDVYYVPFETPEAFVFPSAALSLLPPLLGFLGDRHQHPEWSEARCERL